VFGGYHGTGRYDPHPEDPDDERKAEEDRQYARHALAGVECYDPAADNWMERAPMPLPRQNMSAALGADGRIYVIGGFESYSGSTPQKDVQIYDPRTDRWVEGPSLNTPRGDHAVVATPDGKIYVIGGTDQIETASIGMLFGGEPNIKGGPLDSVEMLDTANLK
jgi:hypothetical protein